MDQYECTRHARLAPAGLGDPNRGDGHAEDAGPPLARVGQRAIAPHAVKDAVGDAPVAVVGQADEQLEHGIDDGLIDEEWGGGRKLGERSVRYVLRVVDGTACKGTELRILRIQKHDY